jgi:hypothetical protein
LFSLRQELRIAQLSGGSGPGSKAVEHRHQDNRDNDP